jgi:hypothetical protein
MRNSQQNHAHFTVTQGVGGEATEKATQSNLPMNLF